MVVYHQANCFLVAEQLRDKGAAIVLEPVGRNSAPAIAAAALLAEETAPGAVLWFMAADAAIGDVAALQAALAKAAAAAQAGANRLASTQSAPDTKQDKAPNHPKRAPLPDHLPRERIVLPSPSACPCCSGTLVKLGEDVTETLEVIPRQWKVIQTVREKFACRSCEAITQPPAPFHPIMRGRAGPHLLATILEAKFGQHLPINRLSETFAREGIHLSTATITPLMMLIDDHTIAAERLHGDDTTVPVLAAGRTDVGRFWTYVRDDAPFGGTDPLAAMFRYSRDRKAIRPERHLANYTGILQADAYAGFNGLYAPGRQPGPILEAACWAHGRRKLFKLAELHHMPIAIEAVRQIDAIFAAEAAINGKPAAERLAVRQRDIAPLIAALEAWMRAERAKLSRHNDLAQAMDYMLKRWGAFTRFLSDGRICLTNNAAERMLRGAALGRKAWLFAGSDQGGERVAAMYSLIQTAKLNGVDPRAWLADVLTRIADMPQQRLHELLPWNWKMQQNMAPSTA